MQANSETIHHLCHQIFIGSSFGKTLLKLLKEDFLQKPVFPQDPNVMARFGGPASWAAFRAGQLDFVLQLERMANEHEQLMVAQQSKS